MTITLFLKALYLINSLTSINSSLRELLLALALFRLIMITRATNH